jgi:hypothetical protein
MALSQREASFGNGWLALCLAFVLHTIDEASTNFIPVYNATVLALRARFHWFPMPTYEFGPWLAGLIVANVVLLALSRFAYHRARWLRPIAYFYAIVMLLNASGHTLATILGHTVQSVRFARPAPGFYSSPALVAGSIYLLIQLRRTRHQKIEQTRTAFAGSAT